MPGRPTFGSGWTPLTRSADVRAAADIGARFVCPGDLEWPRQLDDLASMVRADGAAPLGLWVRGEVDLRFACLRSVSVVGARAATSYGEHVAGDLAAGLADHGCTVVSGGAFGIDGAAHRGSLAAGGTTVAVLACGVDVAYPRGHAALLDRIALDGLLVSEWPPGCTPMRHRFLVRNRVIAALTRGTVVVEAAARSGALATAHRARDLNRYLMAVPGPVTSAMSAGCHQLIREDGAICVGRASEVMELIGAIGDDLAPVEEPATSPRDGLDAMTLRVLDAVPVRRAAGPASIGLTAGLDARAVAAGLGRLFARGLVERLDGGWRLARQGGGGGRHGWRGRADGWRCLTCRGAGSSVAVMAGELAENDEPTVRPAVGDLAGLAPELSDALAQFVRYLRLERGASAHTVRAYTGDVTSLLDHASRLRLSRLEDIDITVLRSWLARLASSGRARTTLARRAASARSFTAFATRRGLLSVDPGERLGSPKVPRSLPAVLRASEAVALLEPEEVDDSPAGAARPSRPRAALCDGDPGRRAGRARRRRHRPRPTRHPGAGQGGEGADGAHRAAGCRARWTPGALAGARCSPSRAAGPRCSSARAAGGSIRERCAGSCTNGWLRCRMRPIWARTGFGTARRRICSRAART